MRKIKYTPYNLDLDYEFETYKNVGKDYGNARIANKGRIGNYLRFRRKRKNRKETYYKFCATYSDWRRHAQNVLNKHICNYDDLLHWLIGKRNAEKIYLDSVKAILIPIYIALITLYDVFVDDFIIISHGAKILTILIIIFLVICCSLSILGKATETVNFYDDFIKIAEEMNK